MTRETAVSKADRLLLEGRVVIVEVNRQGVVAKVRGEGRVHTTLYSAGAWTCTCEVRTDACSHLHAVRRVVAVDLTGRRQR